MAVKTFTTGEVLTASDTNTYLNNGGLVYISSTTVGSTVSSVTVSSCFSSTYDNYKIIYTNGVGSAPGLLNIYLSGITTGYYGGLFAANYSGGAYVGAGDNNAARWGAAGTASTSGAMLHVDVYNPYLTIRKWISAYALYYGGGYGMYTGEVTGTTSATGFVLSPASGTLTGGTITVYGYRKA